MYLFMKDINLKKRQIEQKHHLK